MGPCGPAESPCIVWGHSICGVANFVGPHTAGLLGWLLERELALAPFVPEAIRWQDPRISFLHSELANSHHPQDLGPTCGAGQTCPATEHSLPSNWAHMDNLGPPLTGEVMTVQGADAGTPPHAPGNVVSERIALCHVQPLTPKHCTGLPPPVPCKSCLRDPVTPRVFCSGGVTFNSTVSFWFREAEQLTLSGAMGFAPQQTCSRASLRTLNRGHGNVPLPPSCANAGLLSPNKVARGASRGKCAEARFGEPATTSSPLSSLSGSASRASPYHTSTVSSAGGARSLDDIGPPSSAAPGHGPRGPPCSPPPALDVFADSQASHRALPKRPQGYQAPCPVQRATTDSFTAELWYPHLLLNRA